MKWLRNAQIIIILIAIANSCIASPTHPEEGVDYVLLPQPQKVGTEDKRVEVLEFMLFHCPFCARLDPLAKNWSITNAKTVSFKTLHATFRGTNDPEVRLFHSLDAMNELDTWRPKVFNATQHEGVRFNSENAVLNWARQSGLNYNAFVHAWNSPEVIKETASAPATVKAYGLTYAPAFVIAGKYMTSPSLIQKNNPSLPVAMVNSALFNVLDYLTKQSTSPEK